jgi:membrane-anchored protein YejM (alkaline phosphatase superfamily)
VTDLSAAVTVSISLILVANVYAAIWRRMRLPTDPRRAWKWVRVAYEQSSRHDRINAALFVALVVGVVTWGMA